MRGVACTVAVQMWDVLCFRSSALAPIAGLSLALVQQAAIGLERTEANQCISTKNASHVLATQVLSKPTRQAERLPPLTLLGH